MNSNWSPPHPKKFVVLLFMCVCVCEWMYVCICMYASGCEYDVKIIRKETDKYEMVKLKCVHVKGQFSSLFLRCKIFFLSFLQFCSFFFFSRVHATLQPALSVCPSIRRSVCPSVHWSVRHTLLFCTITTTLRSF